MRAIRSDQRRAAFRAARPKCFGVASKAEAIAGFEAAVCMPASNSSNSSVKSSRTGEADFVSASNSAYDSSTALGVLCLVIATAPRSAACSKIEPNSFLNLVAATVGTAGALIVCTIVGDWTRYIRADRYPPSKLVPIASAGLFIGFVVPAAIGAAVSTAFLDPTIYFPVNLALESPTWYTVLLLPLALALLGLDLLRQAVAELLGDDLFVGTLCLPQRLGRLRAQFFELGAVQRETHDEEGGSLLEVRLPRVELNRLISREGLRVDEFIEQHTLQ